MYGLDGGMVYISRDGQVAKRGAFKLGRSVIVRGNVGLAGFGPRQRFDGLHGRFKFASRSFIVNFINEVALRGTPLSFMGDVTLTQRGSGEVGTLLINRNSVRRRAGRTVHLCKVRGCVQASPFHDSMPSMLRTVSIFYLPDL